MEYYLNPNGKEILEKYHTIIIQVFYPDTKSFDPKIRFSVCKKAISDFRALKLSPDLLADLMITLPETACKFTYEFGDMWEQYYNSTSTNFDATLKFMKKNNLLNNFKHWCVNCVKYASPFGYGFADEIADIYYNYYEEFADF